jgi:hypothetical protein
MLVQTGSVQHAHGLKLIARIAEPTVSSLCLAGEPADHFRRMDLQEWSNLCNLTA